MATNQNRAGRQAALSASAACTKAGEGGDYRCLDWYHQHSPAVARRFLDAVDHSITEITEAPERYPVVRGRLRRVLLRGFPYAIYYKVYPSLISVVGVIHGHRHPDTWLRRAEP